jgi:hexulose-6-phosphate isomerase
MLPRRALLAAAPALALPALSRAAEAPAPLSAIPLPPQPEQGLLFSCKYGMIKGGSLEERLALAKQAGYDGVDFDAAGGVTPADLRAAAVKTGVFIHNAINHGHWNVTLTSANPETRAKGLENLKHCLRCSHAAGGSAVLLVIGVAKDGPEGADRAREEIRKAIPLAAALGQRILFENVWNGMFYQDDGARDQSVQPWADYIDSFNSPWVGAFFDLGNHARYGDVAAWVRGLGRRIEKFDIKGYSNAKADAEGKWKGFVDITAGDIDWASVRAAISDIGFTGWVSAEVGGGGLDRLKTVLDQMKQALLG